MDKKTLHMITFILMAVGALNWGLVGLLGLNLVNLVFGGLPVVERLVYIVVGASAVYEFVIHKGSCKLCGSKK